jgi:hypothetical protein
MYEVKDLMVVDILDGLCAQSRELLILVAIVSMTFDIRWIGRWHGT